MTPSRGAAAALLLLFAAPAALAATLELPASATVAEQETEALGSHRLATGPWSEETLPTVTAEGAITREVVRIETPGLTTLQILAPLRDQLAAQGYETLLDCETEACGGFDFRAAVEVLPPPAMFVDLADFRYLSARKGDEALSLLVSRSAETGFVQIVRVAPAGGIAPPPTVIAAAPPQGPVPPPPALRSLPDRLEAEGRVVLEGLSFATGSADLAAGGDTALAALAAWLAADPSRRVAIVGHTDALGPLEANVALSRRRAQAVAARLASDHGVPRAQLEAHGMGWLSPRATNLTPEGREANRRVEAVLLP
jgi:OOP family OmpA-OmpF porin